MPCRHDVVRKVSSSGARRKGYWSALKLLTGLIGIVLLHTFPFSAYADDVLEKLNLLEITISNLTIRIDALEKRLAAIEKTLIRAPKTEAKELVKEVKPEPKPKEVVSPAGSEDFVSIGGGFLLGNVNYKASLGDTIFSGEIENQSTKDYKTVIFNIKVFDEKGTVLGGSDFYVQELYKWAKVPFTATIFGVNTKSIARYEIKFDRGF